MHFPGSAIKENIYSLEALLHSWFKIYVSTEV